MRSNFDTAYGTARRAYELGRVRAGVLRGSIVTAAVALAAYVAVGSSALAWLPVTFVVAALAEWRGSSLVLGVRRGLVAGLAMLALPLSILRPCCQGAAAATMGADCCTMPEVCVATGALYGIVLAFFLPKIPADGRMTAAFGMALGASAVASARCAPLFIGESVGLLSGLFAGVVMAGVARAWAARRDEAYS